MRSRLSAAVLACFSLAAGASLLAAEAGSSKKSTVRIASTQPRSRFVDWHETNPDAVLAHVDKNIGELEKLIDQAAEKGCDVVAFPEETLCLGKWAAGNTALAAELRPKAVERMLSRFGAKAAKHRIYVLCSEYHRESDGNLYNTAFLLGRNGKELGRYHKVCPTIFERVCTPGSTLPVVETPDLGGVGMLICYDMVFPEPARCLALAGADIIFHLTLGGAAMGGGDISDAAFRTRAVENFVYIVVSMQGHGSMIISPKGEIIAQAEGPDSLVIADINPFEGRDGGDAMNSQRDMRARLFRERNPAAFGMLTNPNPPVLAKVPAQITEAEAIRIAQKTLTIGEEEFNAAAKLAAKGEKEAAIAAFKRLRREYHDSWIDRVSKERLAALDPRAAVDPPAAPAAAGIADRHPGDVGIDTDPDVLFADNFESGDMKKWDEQRGRVALTKDRPNGGQWCVEIPMKQGRDNGGDAIKWFMPGADAVFARAYVKFSANYQYNHHFLSLLATLRTNRWSAFGKAGKKPDGTYYSTGMEPWFAWGKNPSPGEINLYSYFLDMEVDPKMNMYWGNAFFPPGPGRGEAAGAGRVIPKLDQWQCWEFMIQANSAPDKADGKQAMWLDGKLVAEFTGIRWRNDPDLKVNCFWLQHYGYDPGDPTKEYWKDTQSVWFDDLVIARKYIGPRREP